MRRYAGSSSLVLAAFMLTSLLTAPAPASPRLTQPKPRLRVALHCQGRVSRARRTPVLLLPGTGSDGSFLYPTGFQVALSAGRVPSCSLDLPGHNLGDEQVSARYVVSAMWKMAKQAQRRIAVYGFSQGGVLARIALTFWPDTRSLVSDVVSASAPQHGSTNLPRDFCSTNGCAAAVWQRLPDSRLLAVLNNGDETPGKKTAWTTLRTLNDTTAVPVSGPNPTSALRGASNLVIQDICPDRQVRHVEMAFDAVAYAALRDAMRHEGPAQAGRLRRGDTCATQYVGDVTEAQVDEVNTRIVTNIATAPTLPAEPPVTLHRTR